MKMTPSIKVTKSYHYDIEGAGFNAVLSEDFYNHDPKRPFVMTINHSETKERVSTDWYKSKDDALDFFRTFVPFANLSLDNNDSELN